MTTPWIQIPRELLGNAWTIGDNFPVLVLPGSFHYFPNDVPAGLVWVDVDITTGLDSAQAGDVARRLVNAWVKVGNLTGPPGKGEKGDDGLQGVQGISIVQIFAEAPEASAIATPTTGSINVATMVATPPAGWRIRPFTPQAGNTLRISEYVVNPASATTIINNPMWSEPYAAGSVGPKGERGDTGPASTVPGPEGKPGGTGMGFWVQFSNNDRISWSNIYTASQDTYRRWAQAVVRPADDSALWSDPIPLRGPKGDPGEASSTDQTARDAAADAAGAAADAQSTADTANTSAQEAVEASQENSGRISSVEVLTSGIDRVVDSVTWANAPAAEAQFAVFTGASTIGQKLQRIDRDPINPAADIPSGTVWRTTLNPVPANSEILVRIKKDLASIQYRLNFSGTIDVIYSYLRLVSDANWDYYHGGAKGGGALGIEKKAETFHTAWHDELAGRAREQVQAAISPVADLAKANAGARWPGNAYVRPHELLNNSETFTLRAFLERNDSHDHYPNGAKMRISHQGRNGAFVPAVDDPSAPATLAYDATQAQNAINNQSNGILAGTPTLHIFDSTETEELASIPIRVPVIEPFVVPDPAERVLRAYGDQDTTTGLEMLVFPEDFKDFEEYEIVASDQRSNCLLYTSPSPRDS